MTYTFIARRGDDLPVAVACRVLRVSRAGFYAWRAQPCSDRDRADAELTNTIVDIHRASRRSYGSPRVHAELRLGLGQRCGRKRVERLMRQAGVVGIHRRRGRGCTKRDPEADPSEDLVQRSFDPAEPDRLWVMDVTEHPTAEGGVYLAVVLDAFSRRVVGWSIADHVRAELVVDAVQTALWRRCPPKGQTVAHSDHGSQGEVKRSSQHPDPEVAHMGRRRGWAATATRRPPMRSPGRPPVWRREHQQGFWNAIAAGVSSENAAVAVGLSSAVGNRWFREGGGMRTVSRGSLSGRYLCFEEREEIAILKTHGHGIREIARRLGRPPSTISRELRRNAATRGGRLDYRATSAQWHADRRARRPTVAKLATNGLLKEYVQDRLAGAIAAPDGTAVSGPTVRFIGRRHGPRQDRRWAKSWSPEQISNRLTVDFPDDESMRISHEAIYQALFVHGRGALKRELVTCLRTGRALRVPRARAKQRRDGFVSPEVMISARPAEVEDRAVPGHWEGDLIIGLDKSAIGTLVERTTRFTMLLHLPRGDGYGTQPRVKNGPAMAGYGAEAVRDAIASKITTLPAELRRSLTWDRGREMARHADLKIATGIAVYFCDPQSPWQRGTNENTNRLLRQYFPKGTDLTRHSTDDLAAVAATLNGRPRKTLGWRTPAEALDQLLQSA